MRNPIRKTVTIAVAAAAVLGSAAVSLAATSGGSSSSKTYTACVKDHKIMGLYVGAKKCPSGQYGEAWNQTGPQGLQGKTGATGAAGATGQTGATGATGQQGPSGVVATTQTQLVQSTDPTYSSSASGDAITTGGSFTKYAVLLPTTVNLSAGTYLINVNFEATPDATTGGDVFPQVMVYDGPVNATFSNDLFNVGSGALENPTATILSDGDLINSYFSGSDQIVVPAGGETLNIYAFGYDSDTGAGSYTLNSATVTATQLNVSS